MYRSLLITVFAHSLFPYPSVQAQSEMPLIVAHRGASHDAPENTLPAFELAWKQGADAIEGDFYLTKDRRIVCIHDKSTKRYCDQDLAVAESTFEALRQLDVGSYKAPQFRGTRIPSFAEVVQTIPQGKKIYVEIKCGPEIIPVLDQELKASQLSDDQVIIISFNSEVIRKLKAVRPNHKAYWLAALRKKQEDVTPGLEQVLLTLRGIQADGFSSSQQHLNEDFLKSVQDKGFEYHVWTVNDPDAARRLADWGVQSITTDRPGLIRKVLEP